MDIVIFAANTLQAEFVLTDICKVIKKEFGITPNFSTEDSHSVLFAGVTETDISDIRYIVSRAITPDSFRVLTFK